MRLFVSILEGDSPQNARPLLASEDARLVRVVAREINRRLGCQDLNSSKAEPRMPQGGEANAQNAN
jgi:hypothetical protein